MQARGQPRKAVSSGGLDAILGVMLGLSSAGEQNEVKNPQIPTTGLAAVGELRGGAGALWGRTEKVAKGSIKEPQGDLSHECCLKS